MRRDWAGKSATYRLTYNSWKSMIARCTRPHRHNYPKYGGRGITVCERWMSFDNFLEDMGDRPSDKTLDRIDNNQGYFPANCRWATNKEQSRNRRDNQLATVNGITKTLPEWSDATGIAIGTLEQRRRRGWSDERMISVAVRQRRAKSAHDNPYKSAA